MLRRGKSPGPDKRRSSAATSLIVVTARGVMAGSPEQISNRLKVDFPDDRSNVHLARSHPPGPLHSGPRRPQGRIGELSARRACFARATSQSPS